jgi:hypothetical protein
MTNAIVKMQDELCASDIWGSVPKSDKAGSPYALRGALTLRFQSARSKNIFEKSAFRNSVARCPPSRAALACRVRGVLVGSFSQIEWGGILTSFPNFSAAC